MSSEQIEHFGIEKENKSKNLRFQRSRFCVGILILIALISNLALAPYAVYVQFAYSAKINCINDENSKCVNVTLPCIDSNDDTTYNTTLKELNIPNIRMPELSIIPPMVVLLLLIIVEFIIFYDAYAKYGSEKISTLILVLAIIAVILVVCSISYIIMLLSIGDVYYYQAQGCYQLNSTEFFKMAKCYSIINLIFLLFGMILTALSMFVVIRIRKH